MSTVSPQRKTLISLVCDIPEEKLPQMMNYVMREVIGYDEDEPPLTEDEIEGLKLAEQDIAEGRIIPFEEALKELW
ncbi:MAG: hypothetical protein IJS28_10720 [Synergistaceae bacterium]|nr:hypothetical protein [Synergistaceae bacterium]